MFSILKVLHPSVVTKEEVVVSREGVAAEDEVSTAVAEPLFVPEITPSIVGRMMAAAT